MGIQIQYEREPDSQSQTLEERYRAACAFHEWQKRDDPEFNDLPPDPHEPDSWQHGMFTFQVADLEALMRLVEQGTASLLVGTYQHRLNLRPIWHEQWPFTPTEFYNRVRTSLRALRSPEDFNWALLEPVYPLRGWATDVGYLVAWLLEHSQATAQCKVCRQTYQVSDLDIYDWTQAGELEGGQYTCPEDHVLLTTTHHFEGALSNAPFRRKKRNYKPNV